VKKRQAISTKYRSTAGAARIAALNSVNIENRTYQFWTKRIKRRSVEAGAVFWLKRGQNISTITPFRKNDCLAEFPEATGIHQRGFYICQGVVIWIVLTTSWITVRHDSFVGDAACKVTTKQGPYNNIKIGDIHRYIRYRTKWSGFFLEAH